MSPPPPDPPIERRGRPVHLTAGEISKRAQTLAAQQIRREIEAARREASGAEPYRPRSR